MSPAPIELTAPSPLGAADGLSDTGVQATAKPHAYIPAFDGLRFIAAGMVLLFHLEPFKKYWQLGTAPYWYYVEAGGHNAVSFFFVLSGFLITWLLLQERARTGTIDVPAFYVRRVLRIWPLYYLIAVLAVFVVQHLPFLFFPGNTHFVLRDFALPQYLALFLFLPNMFKIGMPGPLLGNHLWSIGAEEQFYLVWPWLPKWVRGVRPLVYVFIGIIAAFMAARIYASLALERHQILYGILTYFRFDAMAIGALAGTAYYLGRAPRLLRQRAAPVVLGLACAVVTPFTLAFIMHPMGAPFVCALYAAFLLSLASNPGALGWLASPPLRHLGRISYGIYMYHTLAIALGINLMLRLGGKGLLSQSAQPLLWHVVYYGATIATTWALAELSYRYFETPFLRLKRRFGG